MLQAMLEQQAASEEGDEADHRHLSDQMVLSKRRVMLW